MKAKKSILTIGAVIALGLGISIVSSNKVFAAEEADDTETITFNVKNNSLESNREKLFLESKVHRLAHTGYWGGGPLGGGESPENPFKGKLPDLYPWKNK